MLLNEYQVYRAYIERRNLPLILLLIGIVVGTPPVDVLPWDDTFGCISNGSLTLDRQSKVDILTDRVHYHCGTVIRSGDSDRFAYILYECLKWE